MYKRISVFVVLSIVCTAVLGCSFLLNPLQFNPILLTNRIPEQSVSAVGETFFTTSMPVDYMIGTVWISSTSDGTGEILVDDAIEIIVETETGDSQEKTIDFSDNCTIPLSPDKTVPPIEVTSLFERGINEVSIRLYDICGEVKHSTKLYLVNK